MTPVSLLAQNGFTGALAGGPSKLLWGSSPPHPSLSGSGCSPGPGSGRSPAGGPGEGGEGCPGGGSLQVGLWQHEPAAPPQNCLRPPASSSLPSAGEGGEAGLRFTAPGPQLFHCQGASEMQLQPLAGDPLLPPPGRSGRSPSGGQSGPHGHTPRSAPLQLAFPARAASCRFAVATRPPATFSSSSPRPALNKD